MLKIMIIEDERNHFELIEHAIKKKFPDAMVELCETADLCLERLEAGGVDIIIADYLLAGMTGLQLLEELKKRKIEVPVIMVTGHGDEGLAVKAMKSGAFDYVVKSGDFFELIPELIRKALRDRDLKAKMRRTEEEKKRLQAHLQQAQKMEAIATLAGGIAHQFNNALSSITGHTGLLEMEYPEDEKIMDYAKAMKQSAHRMAGLTSQLLAYARGGKYNPQTMSLSNFVEGTLPIIQHTLDPDIRLETDLPQDVMNVEVDRTQMQMVLSAIVANSNEAIDPPGRIRISTRNMDLDKEFTKDHPGLKPGPYVCLSIEDDGKGMDEETKNRIFEPFFTTHFIGRGLGMAAVYGIVTNHDGTITVDSEPGKGTVVNIYLPAVEGVEKAKEEVVLRSEAEPARGEGTILVIEDEEQVIMLIRRTLETAGYRVLEAMTGHEAVEIARTFDGDIDLALLDIKLPDMRGDRVYPLIMEARPDLKVIVCTGYSVDGPAREILDAGAQDFIQKPFSITSLSEKVTEVLEGK